MAKVTQIMFLELRLRLRPSDPEPRGADHDSLSLLSAQKHPFSETLLSPAPHLLQAEHFPLCCPTYTLFRFVTQTLVYKIEFCFCLSFTPSPRQTSYPISLSQILIQPFSC